MQPYFFPYLGHIDLISKVDQWVVFDVVGYSKKSWMNRNRILHPSSGWQYLTIPVSKSTIGGTVAEVLVKNKSEALSKIMRQLDHYKKTAPNYRAVLDLVQTSFDTATTDYLVDINTSGLRVVCEYLGISFEYQICSELELDFSDVSEPGDWALAISRQLGASEYCNPIGGRDLFSPQAYTESGIDLLFLDSPVYEYPCPGYQFEGGLSILDVLMWNSPENVRDHLKRSGPVSSS